MSRGQIVCRSLRARCGRRSRLRSDRSRPSLAWTQKKELVTLDDEIEIAQTMLASLRDDKLDAEAELGLGAGYADREDKKMMEEGSMPDENEAQD